MQIRSVAVFCGSKTGNNPLFATHTAELGKYIGLLKLTIIYGGGNTGLMGVIANTALAEGSTVIGIIPELLKEWEHHHKGISELHIVADMHVRKRMMYERSDAAIILPGGFGTLDELFEMLTWNQLKIHNKKIYVLNTDGFYDHLRLHLRQLEKEGFLYDSLEERITFCASPLELFDHLTDRREVRGA
ncbi:MAG TPA: TIGR00730 family Rossman fold protein [Puia sp.]|jgi:hypothetical protein